MSHIILDVNMGENFRRKYRFVADRHKNQNQIEITCSSMVSSYSYQIAPNIAAINDLDILACDIQNAYVTAEYRKQVWAVSGTDFGSEDSEFILSKN